MNSTQTFPPAYTTVSERKPFTIQSIQRSACTKHRRNSGARSSTKRNLRKTHGRKHARSTSASCCRKIAESEKKKRKVDRYPRTLLSQKCRNKRRAPASRPREIRSSPSTCTACPPSTRKKRATSRQGAERQRRRGQTVSQSSARALCITRAIRLARAVSATNPAQPSHPAAAKSRGSDAADVAAETP